MLKKSLFWLVFIFFIFPVSNNFCQHASDESFLYKDLPFPMEPVKQPGFPENTVNIKDFGAVSDGIFSNTKVFEAAIAAIVSKGGGTVVIPEGLWLTGPIILKSNVNLYAQKGALVRFTSDYNEYPLVKTWYEGSSTWRAMSPIYAEDAENIAITGEGIFDGNGNVWRPLKKNNILAGRWKECVSGGGVISEDGSTWFPTQSAFMGSKLTSNPGTRTEKECEEIKVFLRPVMVSLVKCKTILLDGVTFQNPPAWTIHPLLSSEITLRNIKIYNEEWQTNADAIDIESCRNVVIYNCTIDAGDDAICMKSGKDAEGRLRGVPTENVIVANCTVYKGHGGFVVGSEMSGGVRNVKVSDCSFIGTDSGLRFKSTRGRGGVVENIYISNINMLDIEREAILYDLYYAVRDVKNTPVPEADESTPVFRNIHMKNITCKGADRAILLQGLPEMYLQNITLENVVIEAQKGMYCSDARQVSLKNVRIYTKVLPVVELFNASNISFTSFECQDAASNLFKISGANCDSISMQKMLISKDKIEISPEVGEKKVLFLP